MFITKRNTALAAVLVAAVIIWADAPATDLSG